MSSQHHRSVVSSSSWRLRFTIVPRQNMVAEGGFQRRATASGILTLTRFLIVIVSSKSARRTRHRNCIFKNCTPYELVFKAAGNNREKPRKYRGNSQKMNSSSSSKLHGELVTVCVIVIVSSMNSSSKPREITAEKPRKYRGNSQIMNSLSKNQHGVQHSRARWTAKKAKECNESPYRQSYL